MGTTASVKVFNFQDPTRKTDFDSSCERAVCIYGKSYLGTNLEVLRILVAFEILVHLEISAQFGRHYLFSTEYFPDLIHKKDFDIYDPVTIFNFQKKNVHKTNIYV